ncbi:PLP-dependent aminotransferase family protein [Bacillus sp. V5-8f]|uniref:aminotransferase-like domain-containing protein n=1 Tax=Bacillus sp. V5-8f TaxID=2053044 RepID=UPI000C76BB14|nr:PLP-dependent aminotransferase family protein [Bacillus sp. V5-8f]PLT32683.1 GntR family transcriptional regulator [Bacillus sp. V5-8f]
MAKVTTGEDFLFQQVYDYVLNRIERKEWKDNDKLPSVRQLAAELDINRLTVLKAYKLLKKHNKIIAKDKVGYYVQPQDPICEIFDHPILAANVSKCSLSEIHQAQVEYNFSQALIDPNLLPNNYFSDYVKRVFDMYPKVLSTYSSVQGDEELRFALSRYFTEQYKTVLTAENLLILSGSQQGIHLVAETFIRPRDTVLFERPSYSAAIDIFKAKGARIQTIDITPKGYDLDQVEHYMKLYRPRLFYLNPTFHNPTGYTVPDAQRKQLVQLAEQYRCLLIEDDAYHDIYFVEKPPAPIYTYDTSGSVIYIRSFCKYISPGLRVAAIIAQPGIMKSLISSKALVDNGSPLLNQKIFLHYFSSPRLQQHLEKLRIALQIRKEIMEGALSETKWEWRSPAGGLNLWVKLPDSLSTKGLLAKSIEQSISFVPGQICDPLKEPSAWIRLSYSYTNEKQIQEGLKKLIVVAEKL